jgi:hypothetical protein
MKFFAIALALTLSSLGAAVQADTPPKLELAVEINLEVGAPEDVGAVTGGRRRLIPVMGGSFKGPQLKGTVLPGGSDAQLLQPDGFTQIDARFVLQTDDGKKIYFVNHGVRNAAPDVLAKLNAGESVDPALVYFRTAGEAQTTAPELQWMNRSLFLCVGERYPNKAVLRVYRVM